MGLLLTTPAVIKCQYGVVLVVMQLKGMNFFQLSLWHCHILISTCDSPSSGTKQKSRRNDVQSNIRQRRMLDLERSSSSCPSCSSWNVIECSSSSLIFIGTLDKISAAVWRRKNVEEQMRVSIEHGAEYWKGYSELPSPQSLDITQTSH